MEATASPMRLLTRFFSRPPPPPLHVHVLGGVSFGVCSGGQRWRWGVSACTCPCVPVSGSRDICFRLCRGAWLFLPHVWLLGGL